MANGKGTAISQRLPIEVDLDQLQSNCLQVLLPICQHIQGWSQANESTVSIEQLSGAMTNLVYKAVYCCPQQGGAKQFAIVRIFGGSDGLFHREEERQIFKLVSDLRLGPRLLADFQNGRAEEFWSGHSITSTAMRQPWVATTIAAAMATFHWYGPTLAEGSGKGRGACLPMWDRLQNWRRLVVEYWGPSCLGHDLMAMEQQMEELQGVLSSSLPPWIAFCHNDLQYGNMMIFSRYLVRTASGNLDPGSAQRDTRKREKRVRSNASIEDVPQAERASLSPTVRFFDYEYASFNHIASDIANHWCEYAADYHSSTPHVLDFSKFPTPFEQSAFAQAYVRKLVKLRRHLKIKRVDSYVLPGSASSASIQTGASSGSTGISPIGPTAPPSDSTGSTPSMAEASMSSLAFMVQDCRDECDIDELAERLRCAALAYVPLSHLHWGLWGLIQAKQSSVDFEFEQYAAQRLGQYARHLPAVLAGKAPDCGQLLTLQAEQGGQRERRFTRPLQLA